LPVYLLLGAITLATLLRPRGAERVENECIPYSQGIGTASRILDAKYGGYTVGVLVQCNYGQRDQLRIAGVPVGSEIAGPKVWDDDVGSIIVVVATDAPLIPMQLKRVAKRVTLGLGRDGSYSGDGSGDIFIAFSTANPGAASSRGVRKSASRRSQVISSKPV
jgi:L-aminopeptidase/D-esterase-like protein